MNLTRLQCEVGEWARKNFPHAKPHQPLLGIQEEAGELAHSHLKMEQGIRVNEDHQAAKADAIGDLLIFAAHYCELNGLEMEECLAETWAKVQQRDWMQHKETGEAKGGQCGRQIEGEVPVCKKQQGIEHDPVHHPAHYTSHASGVECIQIAECFDFSLGNVIKYCWRADEKGNALEDLKKAQWYLSREIERRRKK